MTQGFKTSIVIPAFNEQERLPGTLEVLAEELHSLKVQVAEVLVVDDGSSDETSQVAESFSDRLPNLRVLTQDQNRGKGYAVRAGVLAAESDWILIADADMSTPWTEVNKLCQAIFDQDGMIAIGSRDLPESDVTVHQSFIRENLGKTFNVLIRLLTRLPFRDTQCGFKLVNRKASLTFADSLAVDRFAWDVEFLIMARDRELKIIEVPVTWEHRDASRVHPIFDGFEMAWTVICIQFRRLFR